MTDICGCMRVSAREQNEDRQLPAMRQKGVSLQSANPAAIHHSGIG